MDFRAILFDPIYTIQGVPVKLTLATGLEFTSLTALDKTAGINTGNDVQVPTLEPAAGFRMRELLDNGISLKQLPDATLEMNGFVWTVASYKLRPSPRGENEGEVFLLLSEKRPRKDAMQPGIYDFTIVRGTTTPFEFQLKTVDVNGNETNLFFDDVRLSVSSGGVLLFRKTLVDGGLVVSDPAEAQIKWTPTTAESRQIPLGALTTYEVEIRFESAQDVYLTGTITGVGGLNDD